MKKSAVVPPGHCAWGKFLTDGNGKHASSVADVSLFKFAPFSSNWKEFARVGMKIEVPNPLVASGPSRRVYWVATVVKFAGYKALVKFETVQDPPEPPSHAWISFCSHIPKPIGYCLAKDILLYPVISSDGGEVPTDFLTRTYHNITGEEVDTVAPNHLDLVVDEIRTKWSRFKLNEIVEAMDKSDCGVYRLGRVTAIVGDRIHVGYFGRNDDDEGFWFSQNSSYVHKLGWCHGIGAKLVGVHDKNIHFPRPDPTEILSEPHSMFTAEPVKIEKQMIFEMRHPIFPHKICAGYVVEVLTNGYILAGTDWTKEDELVEFVMHVTSDYLLPINFCRDNSITSFEPPCYNKEDKNKEFSWREFSANWNCKKLDLRSIRKKKPIPFTQGCKLEAIKVTDPTYMGPATVQRICGRLLLLHFDGYPKSEKDSYQWVSCESSNIYPAGYSEMVGHKIRGRPSPPVKKLKLTFSSSKFLHK